MEENFIVENVEMTKVENRDEEIEIHFNSTMDGTKDQVALDDAPYVAILGSGNYGRALSSQFEQSGLKYCVGSSRPSDDPSVCSYEEAINKSDIIFVCIPSFCYENSISPLAKLLSQKIVVDVSNTESDRDPCNALRLSEMLPHSYVMKALNTVSAYTLENGSYGASRDTYVCGDSDEKKRMLMNTLREIGLNPIDKGRLQSAVMIEKLPHRFFPGWGTAILITCVVTAFVWTYSYLRFFWYQDSKYMKKNLNDLGLYEANRIIAWVMFWVLALTYLPGILAGFIQIVRRTKYSQFPNWLDRWMKCRKQLGLICLLLCGIHGCISCLVLGAGEVKHMLTKTPILSANGTPLVLYQLLSWTGQVSLLFATLSLALMTILGITSLPSVNARMSWKEWDFIQRGLGFTSLIFGFLHVIIYINKLWDPNYKYGWKSWAMNPKGNMPPGAWLMPLLPLAVIILKFILMLPGVSCYLNNIRKGKVGYKVTKVTKVAEA